MTKLSRQALQDAYALPDRAQRLAAKQQAMTGFRSGYEALKANWGGYAGFDAWASQARLIASLGNGQPCCTQRLLMVGSRRLGW